MMVSSKTLCEGSFSSACSLCRRMSNVHNFRFTSAWSRARPSCGTKFAWWCPCFSWLEGQLNRQTSSTSSSTWKPFKKSLTMSLLRERILFSPIADSKILHGLISCTLTMKLTLTSRSSTRRAWLRSAWSSGSWGTFSSSSCRQLTSIGAKMAVIMRLHLLLPRPKRRKVSLWPIIHGSRSARGFLIVTSSSVSGQITSYFASCKMLIPLVLASSVLESEK